MDLTLKPSICCDSESVIHHSGCLRLVVCSHGEALAEMKFDIMNIDNMVRPCIKQIDEYGFDAAGNHLRAIGEDLNLRHMFINILNDVMSK